METTSILVVIETIYGYQLYQMIWKTIGFLASFFCIFGIYMKFLITRWLETTSILVVIERIYSYQLKLKYLKNYRLLDIFFLHFWYLDEISDNPLTGDYEYSRSNRENLQLPIQINLSKSRQHFPLFCLNFWNLHEISNILKKNMSLIGQVFLNSLTPKYVFI